MKNEHVLDDLSAYIGGELDEETQKIVRDHLTQCESCRLQFEQSNRLWHELGTLPEEKPGEMMSTRFYEMLNEYRYGMTRESNRRTKLAWYEHLFPKNPAIQFAVIAVSVMVGILVGLRLNTASSDTQELAQLHEEVRDMNRLLTVSMLKQQSASERLQGVSLSYQSERQDPEIAGALLHTLKYDPNVNVRLAALDAISRSLDQDKMRQALLELLPQQSSPLLQIAMVDLMVQAHDKESLRVFKQMIQSPGINASVKEKLQQGIRQLS